MIGLHIHLNTSNVTVNLNISSKLKEIGINLNTSNVTVNPSKESHSTFLNIVISPAKKPFYNLFTKQNIYTIYNSI